LLVAMTAALSGSVFVGQACLCGSPGPQDTSPDVGVIANVWALDGNSPDGTCDRNATPETQASAIAASRQCNPNDGTNVFTAAYEAASPGDKVGLDGGSYGNQSIAAAASKANTAECDPLASGSTLTAGSYPVAVSDYSGCIKFTPQTGETVTVLLPGRRHLPHEQRYRRHRPW
jgi:plastocyanin